MTCIVGVIDGGIAWMGGDRRAVQGEAILDLATSKIWRDGNALIGCSGSGRIMQAVRYAPSFMDEALANDSDPQGWLIRHLIPAIRSVLKEGGCMGKENEREHMESEFLIGWDGVLLTVHGNFDVTLHALPYAAIGSGAETAHGALFAINQSTDAFGPQHRITIALSAAATFQRGVAGPFDVLNTLYGA